MSVFLCCLEQKKRKSPFSVIPGASVPLPGRSGLLRFVSEFVTFDTVWSFRERNDQTLRAPSHVAVVCVPCGGWRPRRRALPLSHLSDPILAGQWRHHCIKHHIILYFRNRSLDFIFSKMGPWKPGAFGCAPRPSQVIMRGLVISSVGSWSDQNVIQKNTGTSVAGGRERSGCACVCSGAEGRVWL